jgi:cytidylate kinase
MIVTIDGPAGAGKSTVSRQLARRLGLSYLNSGYIYRLVTVLVLEKGGGFEDRALIKSIIENLDLEFVEGGPDEDGGTRVISGGRDLTSRLKDPEVTAQVYHIANDPEYRALLVELQRRFGSPGVVAEGRDMGTVIFPEAEHKFFLDASPEERARRQHRELEARGRAPSYEELLASVKARDLHDTSRRHAPLKVAEGARVLSTDGLTPEQVVDLLLAEIEEKERLPR